MWQWIAIGMTAWCAVSIVLGLVIGRVISRADAEQERAYRTGRDKLQPTSLFTPAAPPVSSVPAGSVAATVAL